MEHNRDEIKLIFEEAGAEIARLPAGLGEIGVALLSRSDPLRIGPGANMISYLLPYWVQEQTGNPVVLCRDLAVGNIFAMLHFFVLDDTMDGGKERLHNRSLQALALGPLLYDLFYRRYSRRFPNDSPLWGYFRKYLEEWASAVCRESLVPVSPYDPGQLAHKAAPVKLCATGLLLQAGQSALIAEMEQAVDFALAVLQLSDDWADWREDLPEASRNAFLTLVRETLSLSPEAPLDERMVKRAICHHRCLDRLAEIAKDYVDRLSGISVAPPSLVAFASGIAQGIARDARTLAESTAKLASQGGLYYFLSQK